ncbi:hypothetical protein BC829DRAFT_48159 [Chytridium lagenaria]|nr:hypothetical protein BC829DRAFT_48159 [Chytridium lagenaria]
MMVEGKANIYLFDGVDFRADDEALQSLLATKVIVGNEKVPITLRTRSRIEKTAASIEDELRSAASRSEKRRHQRDEKVKAKWLSNGYTSHALDTVSDLAFEDLSEDNGEHIDEEPLAWVKGDLSSPYIKEDESAVIVMVVDNSGSWSSRGVFGALSKLDSRLEDYYKKAAENDDLKYGSAHLLPIEGQKGLYIALIVAQKQHDQGPGAIRFNDMETGFQKIGFFAKLEKASVHIPRIGQNTPGFDWYKTERILRKCLLRLGIRSLVYYFKRSSDKRKHPGTLGSPRSKAKKQKQEQKDIGIQRPLPSHFHGMRFRLSEFKDVHLEDQVRRRIIAYGGTVCDSDDDQRDSTIILQAGSRHSGNEDARVKSMRWFIEQINQ